MYYCRKKQFCGSARSSHNPSRSEYSLENKLFSKFYPAWTHGAVDLVFGWNMLPREIIWKLPVQSQQQMRITRNTYYNLTLYLVIVKKIEQSTLMVQVKGSVQDSVWTPKFNMKHLKKAEGHISQNVVIITIKMRSIVQIF